MKKITFYLFNAGCIRRGVDAVHIQNYLMAAGYRWASTPRKADIIVVSTCGVVEKNERSSLDALHSIERIRKSGSTVLVTGCVPLINPGAIRKIGDYVHIPNGQLEKLEEALGLELGIDNIPHPDTIQDGGVLTDYLIARSFCRKSRIYRWLFYKFQMDILFLRFSVLILPIFQKVRMIFSRQKAQKIQPYFNIKIADGCLSNCSYCATKFATKILKSRCSEEIVQQFRSGLQKSYEIFQLLSEDSGCYGLDIGSSISNLLAQIFTENGKYKLILIDFHPCWLIRQQNELIPVLEKNQDKVKEIFLPVQSGSDQILQSMKRDYTYEQLVDVIGRLIRDAPEIDVRTSVIVGYPGETEEDFGATCMLLEQLDFAEVTVNRYEDRPGTASSQLENHIARRVIENRAVFLRDNLGCKLLS